MYYFRFVLYSAIFLLISTIVDGGMSYGRGNTPSWVSETSRLAEYPNTLWYIGFSEETVSRRANISNEFERAERIAQSRLMESIIVSGRSTGVIRDRSQQTLRNGSMILESSSDYEKIIEMSTSATIVNMQTYQHHDKKQNKIYVFVAVKKDDLANYYATQIESALLEVLRNQELINHFISNGDNLKAFSILNMATNKLNSILPYRDLLIVVDVERGIERSQGNRISEMLQTLTTQQEELKNTTALFVTGLDIITRVIVDSLSRYDFRVANTAIESMYTVFIDANTCNPRFDGTFHYFNACVNLQVFNMKTSRNETVNSFTGEKVGWMGAQTAAEQAFLTVIPKIWDTLKSFLVYE